MKKFFRMIIVFSIAITAIIFPIAVSVHISKTQALDNEAKRADNYAKDVLNRSEIIADQLNLSLSKLITIKDPDPCSNAHIEMMKKLNLSSPYIQAMGYESNGKILCSSLDSAINQQILGPVDAEMHQGTFIRTAVTFPFAKDNLFIVVERQGFLAIINKISPIDASTEEQDSSLALINLVDGNIISGRGYLKPEWIHFIYEGGSHLQDQNFAIGFVKSTRYKLGAMAVLPIAYVQKLTLEFALYLVPIGILCGLGLSLAILYFARLQQGLPKLIKSALKNNEFYLVYQPIVNLKTGKWVGAEVLLRWARPNGAHIRPDVFIPIAEENMLIQRITTHVINLLEIESGDIFQQYPNFHIGINLSASDITSSNIFNALKNLRQITKAKTGNLIIEATERGILNTEISKKYLMQIREEGFEIAIDDFGTGYSSLSYLEKFELDYLKIDKSFIDSVGLEAATSQVVPHIIEMAKALNLNMIAEGVETEIQVRYLQERGVQFAQGYYFAKPMPFAELMDKMSCCA
jgi:Predicted signal transduction protein containing sensor and EAL domains